jgi:hypothetical protein
VTDTRNRTRLSSTWIAEVSGAIGGGLDPCLNGEVLGQHWSRMSHSHQSTLEHFRTYGWVCIPAAFRAEDATAMCDLIWAALGEVGIYRNDPSTWTTARPEHLQHLKTDPAFHSIGSTRTIQAIDEVLEGQPWQKPRDWGAFFLQFPIGSEWDIPSRGWHLDGDYTGACCPPVA